MTAPRVDTWALIHRTVFPVGGQPAGVAGLYFLADGVVTALDRRSVRLEPGARISFATYFGAVPTAVWRARTPVRRLRLRLHAEGAVNVSVHATDVEGRTHGLGSRQTAGELSWEIELDDRSSGWLWFEAEAPDGTVLSDLGWEAPASERGQQTASIAITTHNRVSDCLGVLRALSSDIELDDRIRAVVVVDQGQRRIRDDTEFVPTAAPWGDRLVVIEQDNLGGSGGFSRGMLEASMTDASHVLLLDDDVILEPETIHRLLAFAEHAVGTPLIGAQMLSLTEPTLLYSYGERVDRSRFWWGPVDPELAALDLAQATIERTPALSRAYDVDFNGWWMCLIPLDVVRDVGAALPLFIKWDDAEYGLRAKSAGHDTITLPGAAIWHMPWTGKDDGLDWQAYFQLRNRLVAALIHGSAAHRTALLASAFAQDVNHVLCLQYGSAAVRAAAVEDVLAGPSTLIPTLREGPVRPLAILRDAGQMLTPEEDVPQQTAPRSIASRPTGGAMALLPRALRVLWHQFMPARRDSLPVVVTRATGKWWSVGTADAVFLRSATGRGGFALRRDRRRAWRLIFGAASGYVRLGLRWRSLGSAHREAVRELAEFTAWRRQWQMPAGGGDAKPGSRES